MKLQLFALLTALVLTKSYADFDPQSQLPDIGNSAQQVLSVADEQRLGEQFMHYVRSTQPIADDPELEDYISSLGIKLASNLPEQPFRYNFFIIQSPVINAFAAPGGHIGINSGLIQATQSETELSSVVAHEIAHVSQRHISRRIEAQKSQSISTMAAVIAAILLAGQNNQASFAALYAGLAGGAQAQLNFTRAHEEEADRVGIQLLAATHIDPRGMASFFSRLQMNTRYSEFATPEILRTHPVTLNRIAEAQSRAEQLPKYSNTDSMGYLLTRSKLLVLTSSNHLALKQQLQQRLENEEAPGRHATRYALAYTAYLAREYNEALSHLDYLLAHDERRLPYLRLQADALYGSGKHEKALELYRNANQLHPYNKSLTVGYAEALLSNKQGAQAKIHLDEYLRNKPVTLSLLKLKAQIEESVGNKVEVHATLAEYYDQLGQTTDAIHQMEYAIDWAKNNPYITPKLQTRLDQLKEQALKEKSEK